MIQWDFTRVDFLLHFLTTEWFWSTETKNKSSLDDILKVTAKDLWEILRYHRESAGKQSLRSLRVADAWHHSIGQQRGEWSSTSSRGTERQQFSIRNDFETHFRSWIVKRSSPFTKISFIQLYDYLVVSSCKYQHIVLKGTHYEKLILYQFFRRKIARKQMFRWQNLHKSKCSAFNEENTLQSCCQVLTYLRCPTQHLHLPCWFRVTGKRKVQPH